MRNTVPAQFLRFLERLEDPKQVVNILRSYLAAPEQIICTACCTDYNQAMLELNAILTGEPDATTEERYKERMEQAKPVLDAMIAWANSIKSAQGKALYYLKEQCPYLTGYLKDGRLELSNNRAERSIMPFVIDRKNFLFANTPKGATTGSAVMFSLVQTAIENGLEPYR